MLETLLEELVWGVRRDGSAEGVVPIRDHSSLTDQCMFAEDSVSSLHVGQTPRFLYVTYHGTA